MAIATQFNEVLDSFHSSFADKTEIPDSLEQIWLKKAIAEFSTEIEPIEYNEEYAGFSDTLDQYVIDTLAVMMKVMYLERHYSKVNKIASIVGRDISINGQGNLQKYTEDELTKTKADLEDRLYNLRPTAYN